MNFIEPEDRGLFNAQHKVGGRVGVGVVNVAGCGAWSFKAHLQEAEGDSLKSPRNEGN